jgi:hypothetical protein
MTVTIDKPLQSRTAEGHEGNARFVSEPGRGVVEFPRCSRASRRGAVS